jgi:hypothetical protein
MLPSNVDETKPTERAPSRRVGISVGVVLVGLLGIALGAGGVLLLLSTAPGAASRSAASASTATTRTATQQTLVPTVVPTGAAAARRGTAPAAQALPDVNGISCDALESTIFHIHVHLAIFFDGQEQLVPFGIGIGQPWQVSDSSEGPFVTDGSCFYWIHTHTEDGVIHIEAPVRRRFTLGDFFAIWQEPLSPTQVGPGQGPVIVYVNGKRDDSDPNDIVLLPHGRIQLNVGQDVPPEPFDFPPGD